jgi:hypothetical protein
MNTAKHMSMCLQCGQAFAAHQRDDMGTCPAFEAPTRARLIRRLRVMAVDALSHDGRPPRSRLDAQVLRAAAQLREGRRR